METEIEKEEIQTEENQNPVIDYDFLHEDIDKNKEVVTSQFDRAFNEANPVIKDYILSEDFEKNIKTICKIEKLEEEKAVVIVENIAVSILVGLIPIEEAKNTLIESFKNSNIDIEPFAAGLILKNIDAYILSDVRKKILQSESNNKERLHVRHLTLKESEEEKEKDELRKILLERTGNLNGKGEVLIKYKERNINLESKKEEEKEAKTINRDTLLEKINVSNISDTEKIKERMMQIKAEEEERIKKLEALEKEKEIMRLKREQLQKEREKLMEEYDKENQEVKEEERIKDEENKNISKMIAQSLSKDINTEENIEEVKEDLEEEDVEIPIKTKTEYSKKIETEESFDPYRESL